MNAKLRAVLWPTLVMLPALAVLLGLGTWQWQRLHWKETLIATVEARTRLAPVDLPATSDWGRLDLEALDYTPVRIAGRFRHDKEVHVFTTLGERHGPFGGQGYWVMTPLERPDGSIVVIGRGFVPLDRKDPKTREAGQLPGDVAFEGLLRRAEGRNTFTPDDDTTRNIWFTRDPARIAAAADLGTHPVAPFYVDARASATPPGGLPQAGETTVTFTNNHLQYVVTWYGLALTLVGVWIAFVRARWTGKAI